MVPQPAGRHMHIRICDYQNVMFRRRQHVHEIGDFEIAAAPIHTLFYNEAEKALETVHMSEGITGKNLREILTDSLMSDRP